MYRVGSCRPDIYAGGAPYGGEAAGRGEAVLNGNPGASLVVEDVVRRRDGVDIGLGDAPDREEREAREVLLFRPARSVEMEYRSTGADRVVIVPGAPPYVEEILFARTGHPVPSVSVVPHDSAPVSHRHEVGGGGSPDAPQVLRPAQPLHGVGGLLGGPAVIGFDGLLAARRERDYDHREQENCGAESGYHPSHGSVLSMSLL